VSSRETHLRHTYRVIFIFLFITANKCTFRNRLFSNLIRYGYKRPIVHCRRSGNADERMVYAPVNTTETLFAYYTHCTRTLILYTYKYCVCMNVFLDSERIVEFIYFHGLRKDTVAGRRFCANEIVRIFIRYCKYNIRFFFFFSQA
jgi:hypothetical protein